jgi:hypothetical protein
MLTLEDDALTANVRTTMSELLNGAEQLKGLAQTLDGFCELSGRAPVDEIKQVAIGVRATAVHALLTAAAAVGLSDLLATIAAVLERVQTPDDDGRES